MQLYGSTSISGEYEYMHSLGTYIVLDGHHITRTRCSKCTSKLAMQAAVAQVYILEKQLAARVDKLHLEWVGVERK